MESYSYEKLRCLRHSGSFCVRTTVPHSAQGHHPRAALSDNPKAQSKLLTCTRGALLDVAVDIRTRRTPSYLKWIGVELTEEIKSKFYPKRLSARLFDLDR